MDITPGLMWWQCIFSDWQSENIFTYQKDGLYYVFSIFLFSRGILIPLEAIIVILTLTAS